MAGLTTTNLGHDWVLRFKNIDLDCQPGIDLYIIEALTCNGNGRSFCVLSLGLCQTSPSQDVSLYECMAEHRGNHILLGIQQDLPNPRLRSWREGVLVCSLAQLIIISLINIGRRLSSTGISQTFECER